MRALRAAPVFAFVFALLLGTSVSAETPVYEVDELSPMQHVTGSVVLDAPTSLGAFSAADGMYHYRDVHVSGAPMVMNDPRLAGHVESTWNWDVDTSGTMPVPAWGTMRIDVPAISTVQLGGEEGAPVNVALEQGAWSGDFTGIRHADGEPFMVRAFLMGEGAYDGLCAVLDVQASEDGWLADGVIHVVPTAG